MRTRSLRFRLTIWYTAVLTAGLALFGTLLWLSLRHELNADLERDLDGRAARFESFFRSESAESGVHVSEALLFAIQRDHRRSPGSGCWNENSV
jgi:hypothetical protein